MIDPKATVDNAQIMHSLGQLAGSVHAMHQGLTARIEDMRADIRRLEAIQSDRMDRMETSQSDRMDRMETNFGKRVEEVSDNIKKRIDGVETRVNGLEKSDKRIIEKVAKLSALGGGIGGALSAALVEIVKHF